MTEREMSPAAEVAGYAGGVLTLVGVGYLLGEPWRESPDGRRALLLGLVTVLLLGTGHVVRDATDGSPARRRLSGLLWLAVVGTAAGTADMLLHPSGGAAVVPGLVAVVVAIPLYLLQRRGAQALALVLAAGGLASGIVQASHGEWQHHLLVVGLVGTVALLAGIAGLLRPPVAFAAAGLFLVFVATVALSFDIDWTKRAVWYAALCAVVALAAAAWRLGSPLDALAAFGGLVIVSRLLQLYAAGTTRLGLAALAGGVLLLTAAMVSIRWRGARRPEPVEPA